MITGHHIPVLLNESLDYLITNRAGIYFEGTLGFGGHSLEILKRLNEEGILISTDVDGNAFKYCKEKFKNEKFTKNTEHHEYANKPMKCTKHEQEYNQETKS